MSVQRGARRKTPGGGVEYSLQDAFQIFDTISNSVRSVNSVIRDNYITENIFFADIGQERSLSYLPR